MKRAKPLGFVTGLVIALAGCVVATVVHAPPGRGVAPADVGEAHRIRRDGPPPAFWPAATSKDSRCWVSKPEEKGFLRLTNEDRERGGRSRLRLDPELSKVARKHTLEMTDQDLLHHTSSDALRRRITFWNVLGENVGVGATVDSLQVAFMNSPGHRDNIMYGSFRRVGIGTRSAASRLWVTVIFQAQENPGTTLRMPKC